MLSESSISKMKSLLCCFYWRLSLWNGSAFVEAKSVVMQRICKGWLDIAFQAHPQIKQTSTVFNNTTNWRILPEQKENGEYSQKR
jgi:hypothetical protein